MELNWTEDAAGDYTATFGDYTAEVYHDDQSDDEDNDWAYRVTGPTINESGACDDLGDGQAICRHLIEGEIK